MKIIIVENPRPLTMEHYNDVANAPLSASLHSGYAMAVARANGWDTVYLDFSADTGDATSRAALILGEDGDLVLFHWVYSWGHEQELLDIMDLLHRNGTGPVGAFGLFPTLAGRHLLKFAPRLDFILAGEFEDTLADLLHNIKENRPLTALPGIVDRNGSFVPRPLIDDLSRLPIPDDLGANCGYSSLNIAASRGCHGECSFCFIHTFYGCSRRRVRSADSLKLELETRLARRVIKSLYFTDPSFIGQGAMERERIKTIGRMALEIGLPFGFETRVDSIEPELLATLVQNGASSVFLGIESGCDAVLKRVGKRITKEQIVRAVRTVQDCGIQLSVGFIMFEPDTTLAELEENYALLDNLGLLRDHDLTANLLYHNQIVLYGSATWKKFEQEERLLIDPRTPFEARYRFSDERVGYVCSAMERLATAYFKRIDDLRRSRIITEAGCSQEKQSAFNREDLNLLLKEAFRALSSAAEAPDPRQINRLTRHFVLQAENILS